MNIGPIPAGFAANAYMPYTLGSDPEVDRLLRQIRNSETKTVIHHETCPCCGAKLVNLYRKSTKDKEWKCRKCWEEEVE